MLEGVARRRRRERDAEEGLFRRVASQWSALGRPCRRSGTMVEVKTALERVKEGEEGKTHRMRRRSSAHRAKPGDGDARRWVEVVDVGEDPTAAVVPTVEGGEVGAAGGEEGCLRGVGRGW